MKVLISFPPQTRRRKLSDMAIGMRMERAANQRNEISMEEFKKWLKRFDSDGDNRISVEELRSAIKDSGGWWFCNRKAKRGVEIVDKNFNGGIDDHEIKNLVEFAQKYLGIKII